MACSHILESALDHSDFNRKVRKGSTEKELVIDLQKTLFELGFSKELRWEEFQADGDYGNATTAAVAAFAIKNGISSDGTSVTKTLARVMLHRHDFLPEMYLLWAINKEDLRTRYFISKGTRTSIAAVQTLLHEMGFDEQLNWAKFGADGLYGNGTRSAVKAYAKRNGIDSDGDWLKRPLIDQMIEDINAFYGKNWSDLAENHLPGSGSPLVFFEGSRFQGKPCQADKQFVPMLNKINTYAEQADVNVHVTSSFRTTTNVNGAIVKPATFSNHLAGHAIDMNLVYGNNKWANSKVLAKYPNVPPPVKQFIKSIIDDSDLRWGGKFTANDPVHIDDHLNKDMAKWKKRYQAMQKAVQLGM